MSLSRSPSWLLLVSGLLLISSFGGEGQAAPASEQAYRIERLAESWWLLSPRGRRIIDLLPSIVLRAKGRRWRARFVPLPPREEQGGALLLRAEARAGSARYELLLRAPPGRPLELDLRGRHGRSSLVKEESLRFALARGLRLSSRDSTYRWRRVRRREIAGRHAPQQLRLELLGEGAVVGWQSRGGTARGSQALVLRRRELSLELDHHANHPFFTFTRCLPQVEGFEAPSRWRSGTRRRAGEDVDLRGTFTLGGPSRVVLERLPDGYGAALVLTDHADQSSLRKLEAFAFGRTGALSRGEVGPAFPGFVNRGLRYTKTVFLARRATYPRQFSDPRYRRVLDAMANAGVEIGLHSVTGAADRPALTKKLVGDFRRRFKGRSWIDHQPYTNCEAISNRGWDAKSRWYSLGVLGAAGFRYLWGVPDMARPGRGLDVLGRGRRPLLYTHRLLEAGSQRFVLFRSSYFFWPWRRFIRELSPSALDKLEGRSGLAIGHVYLDTYRREGPHASYGLIVARRGGYALRPEVDALFRRLARRQARGTLWVTGIEALGDHLHVVEGSAMRCAGARCDLEVGKPWPEAGPRRRLTLRVDLPAGAKAEDIELLVDGKPAERSRSPRGVARFRFAASGRHRLEVRFGGKSLTLAGEASVGWK